MYKPENHCIELADGSRACGIVSAEDTAKVLVLDLEGVPHEVFLEDALYIPSYKQNIFSVQEAVNKGGAVNLTPNSSELSARPQWCKIFHKELWQAVLSQLHKS